MDTLDTPPPSSSSSSSTPSPSSVFPAEHATSVSASAASSSSAAMCSSSSSSSSGSDHGCESWIRWDIKSNCTLGSANQMVMVEDPKQVTASEVSVKSPANVQVDIVDGVEFKSFESLEEMDKYTDAEVRKMQSLDRDFTRRTSKGSKCTNNFLTGMKKSDNVNGSGSRKQLTPAASSAFMSSSLDEYLDMAKKSMGLKRTVCGAPPKTSKIYNTGVLAQDSIMNVMSKKSLNKRNVLCNINVLGSQESQSGHVKDDRSGGQDHLMTGAKKKRKPPPNKKKTKMSLYEKQVVRSENQKKHHSTSKKYMSKKSNKTMTGSSPFKTSSWPQPPLSVMSMSPDKPSVEDFKPESVTDQMRMRAFDQLMKYVRSDARVRGTKEVVVSFDMDSSYVSFAVETLRNPLKPSSLLSATTWSKEPLSANSSSDAPSASLTSPPSKKTKSRSSLSGRNGDELANMISRHSKRNISLPARYQGQVMGNLGLIPDAPSSAAAETMITEKRARKRLQDEQKRIQRLKLLMSNIPEEIEEVAEVAPPSTLGPSIVDATTITPPPRKKRKYTKRTSIPVDNAAVDSTPVVIRRKKSPKRSDAIQDRLQYPPSLLLKSPPKDTTCNSKKNVGNRGSLDSIRTHLLKNGPFSHRYHRHQLKAQKEEVVDESKSLSVHRSFPLIRPLLPHCKVVADSPERLPVPHHLRLAAHPGNPAHSVVVQGTQVANVGHRNSNKNNLLIHHRMKQVVQQQQNGHHNHHQHHPRQLQQQQHIQRAPTMSHAEELRELYRNLYMTNDRRRREEYQMKGIKPRVNKHDVVREAIEIVNQLKKKERHLNYIQQLFAVWNKKLKQCLRAAESDIVAVAKSSDDHPYLRREQVVADVVNAYRSSVGYQVSQQLEQQEKRGCKNMEPILIVPPEPRLRASFSSSSSSSSSLPTLATSPPVIKLPSSSTESRINNEMK